jgi:hypothetical protein
VVRPSNLFILGQSTDIALLVNCQKACKKCDDGRPCQRCIKHNLVDTCKNSVRKERKKGIKRGPYKRRPMSLLESQHQDSALPVLPQNHKIDQHVTPPSVVASQSDFLTFPIYSLYNDNTIPSPISNHNDIITNRPSPQRHFIHDKPLHNTMYGTPIGSPLLSNEVIPSWIADGTFQYVPQHNAHQ